MSTSGAPLTASAVARIGHGKVCSSLVPTRNRVGTEKELWSPRGWFCHASYASNPARAFSTGAQIRRLSALYR